MRIFPFVTYDLVEKRWVEMKYVKILRVLSIALILPLLVMVLPASAVLAASEDISLDPEKGEIGERIDIDGEDFEEKTI
jgi:hypothetical protein